jgi:hypothetical protein
VRTETEGKHEVNRECRPTSLTGNVAEAVEVGDPKHLKRRISCPNLAPSLFCATTRQVLLEIWNAPSSYRQNAGTSHAAEASEQTCRPRSSATAMRASPALGFKVLHPVQQQPDSAVAELLSWAVSSFKKNFVRVLKQVWASARGSRQFQASCPIVMVGIRRPGPRPGPPHNAPHSTFLTGPEGCELPLQVPSAHVLFRNNSNSM